MFPVVRTMTWVGVLGLTITFLVGCGEKRVHVATVSGTPGDLGELEKMDQAANNKTDGLPGSAMNESSLGREPATAGSDNKNMSEPEPIGAKGPIASLGESAPEGNALPFPEGASLNAQSGSGASDSSSTGFGNLPEATFSDLSESHMDNSQKASQADTAFPVKPSQSSVAPGESEEGLEQIPGALQVAKAEPSDAIREELERMKSEELASATAGLEDIFFQFDSWSLTPEGKHALERNRAWMQDDPSSRLLIEGHADQRGTQAYNMILGKKRAGAIRDYLAELGVDSDRLSIISYGKDKPFCQDPTEVCYQLNRRGHFLVQNP